MTAADTADAGRRPVPLVEDHTAPYWNAARRHTFVLQRCDDCALWIHPPRHACPDCGLEGPGFQAASGRGSIYAFMVSHTSGGPGFEQVPYAVAVVELAEQPGLLTVGNVLGSAPSELTVDRDVVVTFEALPDGTVLPQWELAP